MSSTEEFINGGPKPHTSISRIEAMAWWALWLVASFLVLFFAVTSLQMIEKKFLPVVKVTNFEILEVSQGASDVQVHFDKLRDCQFLKMMVYEQVNGGAISPVDYDFRSGRNGPPGGENQVGSRPVGPQGGPYWTFYTERPGHIQIYVHHQCNPLWVTRTQMW